MKKTILTALFIVLLFPSISLSAKAQVEVGCNYQMYWFIEGAGNNAPFTNWPTSYDLGCDSTAYPTYGYDGIKKDYYYNQAWTCGENGWYINGPMWEGPSNSSITYTGYAEKHIVLSVPGDYGESNLPVCLGSPDPCAAERAAHESNCGGPMYMDVFLESGCIGKCVSCSEVTEMAEQTCSNGIQSFSCSESYTDGFITGLSVSDPVCNDLTCNDLLASCVARCGGTSNMNFGCMEVGGVATASPPCSCIDIPSENPPLPDPPTPPGGDDPGGETPDPADNDNTLLQKITNNTNQISGNTKGTEENTYATANNTKQIDQTLDRELNEANQMLTSIDDRLKKANEMTEQGGITDDVLNLFGSDLDTQVNDTLIEMSDGVSAKITEYSDNSPMDESKWDGIFDSVNLFPSASTCQPIVVDIPARTLFPAINFEFGCEYADEMKALLGYLLAFFTIYTVINVLIIQTLPQPTQKKD